MNFIDENCPLCHRAARYYFIDFENRKFFRCDYCHDFQVYTGAEKLLHESSEQYKQLLSNDSHNSNHERVLFISTATNSDNPKKSDVLHAKFCERADLPLS
jgi:transposase-like protein